MRIVHVVPDSTSRAGVSVLRQEVVTTVLEPLFRAQRRLGGRVEVVDAGRKRRHLGFAGAIGLAALSCRLPRLMAKLPAAVVHIHGLGAATAVAAWVCRRKGVPYALTLTDPREVEAARRARSDQGGHSRCRRTLNRAALHFALDPRALTALRSGERVRKAAPPVKHLPLAIEPAQAPSVADLRFDSPFTVNATPKLVLLASGAGTSERLFQALEVVGEALGKTYPRLQAVLAAGAHSATIRKLSAAMKRRGIDGFLRLLTERNAAIYARQREAALAEANLAIVLSEQLQARLDVLHAWAAATPVLAYDTEEMRELIEDGRTGRLVEVQDAAALAGAVRELLENTELAALIGKQGAKHVRDYYAPERAASEVLAAYQSVYPQNDRSAR